MNTKNFNREKVNEIIRKNVETLPIYGSGNTQIDSWVLENGLWIHAKYLEKEKNNEITTGFSFRFLEEKFHAGFISLEEKFRGKGIGRQMILARQNIARELGCNRIITYPQGRTATGETRMEYLVRNFGYKIVDGNPFGEAELILE